MESKVQCYLVLQGLRLRGTVSFLYFQGLELQVLPRVRGTKARPGDSQPLRSHGGMGKEGLELQLSTPAAPQPPNLLEPPL